MDLPPHARHAAEVKGWFQPFKPGRGGDAMQIVDGKVVAFSPGQEGIDGQGGLGGRIEGGTPVNNVHVVDPMATEPGTYTAEAFTAAMVPPPPPVFPSRTTVATFSSGIYWVEEPWEDAVELWELAGPGCMVQYTVKSGECAHVAIPKEQIRFIADMTGME